jgi:acyl-coenzyme A thioesterase PaaI-like protein
VNVHERSGGNEPVPDGPGWSFGVEPLPEATTAARLLRRVTDLVLALETDDGELDRVVDDLRRAETRLRDRVPVDANPRIGEAVTSAGRVYVDHSRDIGAFNPCFPEYEITVAPDTAVGTVTFPLAFEGPPGIVHGGFLAVFFDCVIQHHNCDLGVAGKTTSLSLRYRRPAPLSKELQFEISRTAVDERIVSTGRLFSDGDLQCEARMEAVAGDRTSLPQVSPRRTRP